jgi:hypothetical protein
MPPPTTAIIPSLPSFLFCAKNDDGDKFSIKNKNKKATNIPVELMNELFLAVSDDKLSSRDEVTITSWYYSYPKQAKIKKSLFITILLVYLIKAILLDYRIDNS